MEAQAPWDSAARAPCALELVADFALNQLGGQDGKAGECEAGAPALVCSHIVMVSVRKLIAVQALRRAVSGV